MSEEPSDEAPDDEAEASAESDVWARDTAPQTPYTSRQIGIGLVVFAIAAVVAFAVPILLT